MRSGLAFGRFVSLGFGGCSCFKHLQDNKATWAGVGNRTIELCMAMGPKGLSMGLWVRV